MLFFPGKSFSDKKRVNLVKRGGQRARLLL